MTRQQLLLCCVLKRFFVRVLDGWRRKILFKRTEKLQKLLRRIHPRCVGTHTNTVQILSTAARSFSVYFNLSPRHATTDWTKCELIVLLYFVLQRATIHNVLQFSGTTIPLRCVIGTETSSSSSVRSVPAQNVSKKGSRFSATTNLCIYWSHKLGCDWQWGKSKYIVTRPCCVPQYHDKTIFTIQTGCVLTLGSLE